jgi:hypothetical protein
MTEIKDASFWQNMAAQSYAETQLYPFQWQVKLVIQCQREAAFCSRRARELLFELIGAEPEDE